MSEDVEIEDRCEDCDRWVLIRTSAEDADYAREDLERWMQEHSANLH